MKKLYCTKYTIFCACFCGKYAGKGQKTNERKSGYRMETFLERYEYLKWICGFSNAKGGKLYIGLNDIKPL